MIFENLGFDKDNMYLFLWLKKMKLRFWIYNQE